MDRHQSSLLDNRKTSAGSGRGGVRGGHKRRSGREKAGEQPTKVKGDVQHQQPRERLSRYQACVQTANEPSTKQFSDGRHGATCIANKRG